MIGCWAWLVWPCSCHCTLMSTGHGAGLPAAQAIIARWRLIAAAVSMLLVTSSAAHTYSLLMMSPNLQCQCGP
jgi:hypothetical protein